MMIERFYLKYKEEGKAWQQIPLSGGFVIDFLYNVQIDIKDVKK